jgi:hypothetical protein
VPVRLAVRGVLATAAGEGWHAAVKAAPEPVGKISMCGASPLPVADVESCRWSGTSAAGRRLECARLGRVGSEDSRFPSGPWEGVVVRDGLGGYPHAAPALLPPDRGRHTRRRRWSRTASHHARGARRAMPMAGDGPC